MFLYSAVLVETSVKTQVGSNTGAGEEYLHCSPDQTHIYLLLNVLIWNGVVHVLHTDVVVVLDGGHLPDS